ncbi:MAG: hypothetical protein EOR06_10830 [Mesorhizobium sp.]|nr:hypothetical protein [Mesorhizobium sp.]RWP54351.1 MAG: hypothetical protein EOR06_10830 [Mesorhizobium sp.]
MEEGVVAPRCYGLAGDRGKRRLAKILYQAKIGVEGEGLDRASITFGVAIIGNSPDFPRCFDRADYAEFGEHRAQQQHVEGDLCLVEGARCPRRLDVDHREMQTGRTDFTPDQIGEAPTQFDVGAAYQVELGSGTEIDLRSIFGRALTLEEGDGKTLKQAVVTMARTKDAFFAGEAGDYALFIIDPERRPGLFTLIFGYGNGGEFARIHDLVARLALAAILKPGLDC